MPYWLQELITRWYCFQNFYIHHFSRHFLYFQSCFNVFRVTLYILALPDTQPTLSLDWKHACIFSQINLSLIYFYCVLCSVAFSFFTCRVFKYLPGFAVAVITLQPASCVFFVFDVTLSIFICRQVQAHDDTVELRIGSVLPMWLSWVEENQQKVKSFDVNSTATQHSAIYVELYERLASFLTVIMYFPV